MDRPCMCNRVTSATYDVSQCRVCWLFRYDKKYKNLWSQDKPQIVNVNFCGCLKMPKTYKLTVNHVPNKDYEGTFLLSNSDNEWKSVGKITWILFELYGQFILAAGGEITPQYARACLTWNCLEKNTLLSVEKINGWPNVLSVEPV